MANTAAMVLEDLLNHLQPFDVPAGATPALPLSPVRAELGSGAIAATVGAPGAPGSGSMIGRPLLVVRTEPAGPAQTVQFTRAGVVKTATLVDAGDALLLVGVDENSWGVLMAPEGGIA